MMSIPELYVLRHGETHWNAEGRMQGALHSPLTPLGRAQAARQGRILAGCDLDGFDLLVSPQGRAFETAEIALAPKVRDLRREPSLREIGVGGWQGRLRVEVLEEAGLCDDEAGRFALYDHAPQGEGLDALARRCGAFLRTLERPAVLVTHGITSRMIRALATGAGAAAVRDVGGGQGVVFHVRRGVQTCLE